MKFDEEIRRFSYIQALSVQFEMQGLGLLNGL